MAIGHVAHVGRMEPIHVFGRIDRLDHRLRINSGGQRQLDQDAVDRRILIQSPDRRQQFCCPVSACSRIVRVSIPASRAARSLVRT